MGISVTGAACVLGVIDGDPSKPALYLVGGSVNSSSIQHAGLLRYSLQDKIWNNVTPVTPVGRNRKHHGAAFLNASSSILLYAGSQDGDSNPSSHTFLIETRPPYNVRSFSSQAPPVVDPTMLIWNESRAALIGGSPTSSQVFTFGPDDGWVDTGVVLKQPPPNRSVAQSALLSLVDESKVLITFDFSQSPNTVTRTVLLYPGGQQAQFGETVGDISEPWRSRRRDVLLSTFPEYNNSLAPRTIRTGASLAQDPNGLIVVAGGNDQDPLSIFNALENRWVDPTQLIGQQSQRPLGESSTSSVSVPTGSATSTFLPTAGGSRSPSMTILGAVLGSISGIAAILIIVLLLLRWKKNKRKTEHRHSGLANDKKRQDGRLSFEDQGMQPIKAAAQPMGRTTGPSNDMMIAGGNGSHHRRTSSTSSRRKFDPQRPGNVGSELGMLARSQNPLAMSRPAVQDVPTGFQERPIGGIRQVPNPNGLASGPSHRKNDSGWSTYFSGNTAIDFAETRKTMASPMSNTSSASRGSYRPDLAAPVAKVRSAHPGLTDSNGNQLAQLKVRTGSPFIGYSADPGRHSVAVTEGIPTKTSNTDSVATSLTDGYNPRSMIDHESDVESAYPSSQPVGDYGWAFQDSSSDPPQRTNRPSSSTYTNSFYPPNVTSPQGDGDWSQSSIRPVTQWPTESMAFPAVPSSRPGTSRGANPPVLPALSGDEVRDYFGFNYRQQHPQNDMSWLDLNGNGRGNGNGNS